MNVARASKERQMRLQAGTVGLLRVMLMMMETMMTATTMMTTLD